jgi:hypothetical protein
MTDLSNVLPDSLHLVDIAPNLRVYELTKSELASWMPGHPRLQAFQIRRGGWPGAYPPRTGGFGAGAA